MKYYIFLVLAVLFWSGNFIFGRLISSSVEPVQLSFFRWFFVFILLLPYMLIHKQRLINSLKKDFRILFLFGALGVAGFNTLLYYGLQTTTATNALLINSSTPIFIIVLSAILLKVKITKIQSLGVLLSSIGVLYLILKGSLVTLLTLEFTQGDLWIILACLDWALYCILLKFKPKDLNAFDFLSITTFIGIVILYILFSLQGFSFEFSFVSSDEVLYSLIYMVIFPSLLSFYFWNESTVAIGANKAGQFTHLMSIFGAILAFLLLGERLEFYHFIGITFIAIGIYISMFYKRKVV
ncbi:DMT family transporter [Poseidonibacter lekithochrous]|uniref:DMT family transporter n=1 Tax=Poseidonibacter lekithochrous TaxID=1904463 RepID=UPI0008FCDF41|nr:DMT family transporter [Poseidonibacter lekithochrous]QKJ21692.1 EamA/RhaT family transporter [Poseidonibacter lekithochrous]